MHHLHHNAKKAFIKPFARGTAHFFKAHHHTPLVPRNEGVIMRNNEKFNYMDYEFEDWNWKPLKWEKLNETLNGGVILGAEVSDYPIAPASSITIYFRDKGGKIKVLNIESENLDIIYADIACKPKRRSVHHDK